tara:strand:- start:85 stop:270 length:186 start_codon:yes stop_codon:yes gene_type:complete
MSHIAVIDLSTNGLFLYSVPKEFGAEAVEEFIIGQGHHLSNCSWGEFDGDIVDLREYINIF